MTLELDPYESLFSGCKHKWMGVVCSNKSLLIKNRQWAKFVLQANLSTCDLSDKPFQI